MMALVVILGCWLGYVCVRARTQADAVRAIKSVGGAVMYDDQFAVNPGTARPKWWAPRWLVDRLGKDYFYTVVAARLSGPGVGDAELAPLGSLGRLQSLNIDSNRVSDAGLAHLGGLVRLEKLIILNTPVGDAGLRHLDGLGRLRLVVAQGTRVSAEGARRLKRTLPRVEMALD